MAADLVEPAGIAHRARAIAAARSASAALAGLGVTALVTGSLARGWFFAQSDIDLLVTRCPTELKYAIEGIVEDIVGPFTFDVIYLDELPEWKAARFAEGAVDARHLR